MYNAHRFGKLIRLSADTVHVGFVRRL